MMKTRIAVVALLSLIACGDDTTSTDAGETEDSAQQDGVAGAACEGEGFECDDGVFCNGVEMCDPDGVGADSNGCVSTGSPCAADQGCDETLAECVSCVRGGEFDMDGDGFCSNDCDDSDPLVNPDAVEVCVQGEESATLDEDCNPATFGTLDADGDGYIANFCCNGELCGNDCVDSATHGVGVSRPEVLPFGMTPASIHPDLPEVCDDEVDNDCNGDIDGLALLYPDLDGDGYGDPGPDGEPQWLECGGLTANNGDDCNDERPDIYLGAVEQCDGWDNDCRESPREAAARQPSDGAYAPGDRAPHEDRDMDRFTDLNYSGCSGFGEGGAPGSAFPRTDCNDSETDDFPGAFESCGDDRDNDCDGDVDEARQQACDDNDGDGHGNPTTLRTLMTCALPPGTVESGRCADCDDSDPDRFPTNVEYCDRFDSDCSSGTSSVAVDEDSDEDGHAPTMAMCLPRADHPDMPLSVFERDDCDDTEFLTNTDSDEVCGGLDEDCDGRIDEGMSGTSAPPPANATTYYRDFDRDGFGDPGDTVLACSPPDGYVATGGDCDDRNRDINPDAEEQPANAIDEDCDGGVVCWGDADRDGYRAGNTPVVSADADCNDPGEQYDFDPSGDCNDSNASIYPGASDAWGDGVDQNCDGRELCFRDADNDGYRPSLTSGWFPPGYEASGDYDLDCMDNGEARSDEPLGDCNDSNGAIHPGATELVGDQRDQNCDGRELCWPDQDRDGYRLATGSVSSSDVDCTDPGEAATSRPTESANPAIYAGTCCDRDARMNQDAVWRSDSTGNTACGNSTLHDWDCNGTRMYRWTAFANICTGWPSCSDGAGPSQGWDGSYPRCGLTDTWRSNCHTDGFACVWDTETRRQQCR